MSGRNVYRVSASIMTAIFMSSVPIACGDDGGDVRDATAEATDATADTAPDDTADTTPEDIADTTPDDTTREADTTPEDIADTTPQDIADTTPGDTDDGADGDVSSGPRITLVLDPGGRGDRAFNDMAAAGLERAASEISFNGIELVAGDEDVFAILIDAAARSELVICVGFFFFVDAVEAIAPIFPEVHFAVIDAYDHIDLPNVSYHMFAVEQGSFLVGAAAALTTRSRKLGFIGGMDVQPVDLFEAGFRAGVAHVGLEIPVESLRLSRFPDFSGLSDPDKAYDEALRMYEAGVDVIFHAAGASGLGLFAAAADHSAAAAPVWAIGVDSDQYRIVDAAVQPHLLTSMLKRVDEAVYRLVLDFVAGDVPSGLVLGDLASGMVGYAVSGGHLDAISAELEALAAEIVSGAIVVPTEIPPVCTRIGDGLESEGWTVFGGAPVRRGHSVQGCMLFTRQSGADTRGGGVCLVADLHGSHPCVTAADCAALSLPGGGFHYCAAPDGGLETTCWTRPGPPDAYCDRNPARSPGVAVTPLVPADALPGETTWLSYACMAHTASPGGCATGDSVSDGGETLTVALERVGFYGCDGNLGDYLGEQVLPGIALAGMMGTLPGSAPSDDFAARIAAIDPLVPDLFYAPETYDAVIIAALAAEVARASQGAPIAEHLPAVTTRGERCSDFATCRALIDVGSDIDYDGLSGPIELTAGGEPTRAAFVLISYGPDNRLDVEGARQAILGDGSLASAETPPAPPRDTAPSGTPLRIGALLPETGGIAFLGPGMRAAAELAVADINAAGGVNGAPVELLHADEGGFDDDVIHDSVAALLAAEVDVVIGAAASARSLLIIDTLVAAGVVQISPSNTSDVFVDYDDQGLYFRTAPANRLQGRALAEAIQADGHARVAALVLDDDYGHSLAANLVNELTALGHAEETILTAFYGFDGPYEDAVAAVVAHEPDAIALIGFDEARLLIELLADHGLGPAPRPLAETACRTLDDGAACGDGDPCTRDTICGDGRCGGGIALACGPGDDGGSCGACGGAAACTLDDAGATCGAPNACTPQPNPGCGATGCCQDVDGYQSVCCGAASTYARRLCTGPGTCPDGGAYPCAEGVEPTCPQGTAPCADTPTTCCNSCGPVGPLGCAVCADETRPFATRCEVFHDGQGCTAIVE